ncbi:unnamed protein product [Rhizoctonia solani]|uniref:Uncharacterized protein n=1 Tax=Rhizoctonia solani TaxID=456999 RepID=A0A8H3BZF8_9AGAM|nr:unnamed protein product [Rhizoctonia solani]
MAGTKRNISTVQSPGTQSRLKKGKQVANEAEAVINISSGDEEYRDPTYPTPNQTIIADDDSDDDSDDNPGVISTAKTRSKQTGGKTAAAGPSKAPPVQKAAPKPRAPRKKKADDDFIVADDESEVTKPKRRRGRPRKKTNDEPAVSDDEAQVAKPKRRKRKQVESDEDELEDKPEEDADANALDGYGQKKHTLEWLHMTYRSALLAKAQVNITETLKNESERALTNAKRKLENDKAVILNQQVRLQELEHERLERMTPVERETYAQLELEQLQKEIGQLKIRCATKDAECTQIKKELVEMETKLQQETSNRMAMETKLIRAGMANADEAFMNVPTPDIILNNRQLQQAMDLLRAGVEQLLAGGQSAATVDQPPATSPATGPPPAAEESQDQPADPPRGRPQGGSKYVAMAQGPTSVAGSSSLHIVPPPPPKGTKRGQVLRNQMERTYRGDDNLAKAAYNELMQELSEATYVGNPFTMKHRDEAYTAHVDIAVAHQLATEDQCWHINVIRQHAEFTLVYRIKHARGPGGGPIQSRTAMSWLTHHTYNICVHTIDPVTKRSAGLTVMREGLYGRLEQRVRWAIREFQLLRHPKTQPRLDMAAIQLIMEQILSTSTTGLKRRVGLQTISAMLMCFYGAFRRGSLTSSDKSYQERGLYFKVGECEFPVLKPGRWKMVAKINNWKGYSGEVGHSKTFTFDPVNKAHNVNFDLPLCMALFFLSRGFFVGITDFIQLFEFNGDFLPLDPQYANLPVYVARTRRGLDLIEGKPIRMNGLASSINHHGGEAGIADAAIHPIRRGTSDVYAAGLAKDRAMMVMNHTQAAGAVFDNYTVGVEAFPLVGVRLEEFSGNLSPLERQIIANTKSISPAINCLIHRAQATGGPLELEKKTWRTITVEEEEKLMENADVYTATNQHKAKWLNYTSLFPNVVAPYSKECKRLVPKIKKHITPATSQQADIRLEEFEKANLELTNLRRKVLLKIRQPAKKQALKQRPKATAAERAAAREKMEKPGASFDEAMAMYQTEATLTGLVPTAAEAEAAGDPGSVQTQSADLPATAPDDSRTNYVEDDEEEIEMVPAPLPGKGLSLNDVPEFDKEFLPIHNSKRTGPKPKEVDSDTEDAPKDGSPVSLEDENQAEFFGIDVDIMRMIYGRYLYGPIEQGLKRQAAKRSEKLFICGDCPKFLSRVEKLVKQLKKQGQDTTDPQFTFSTEIIYNRHMRVRHCAWMNLELEMQQKDSTMLICPGCQEEFSNISLAHKHCRTECPKKSQFIPLYDDYIKTKPVDNPIVLRDRKDNRREQKWENKDVPITRAGLEVVRKLRDDLEANPNAFEEWFASIPEASWLNNWRLILTGILGSNFGNIAA